MIVGQMTKVLAGMYLILTSMIWLSVIKPWSSIMTVFSHIDWARGVGYACFAIGVFFLLPQIWMWRSSQKGIWTRRFNITLRNLWGGGGALIALAGLVLMFGALGLLESSQWVYALLGVMTGAVSLAGGTATLHGVWANSLEKDGSQHSKEARPGVDPSNLVLRVARKHRGRLTAPEVAAESDMHYKEAARVLETMAADGVCEACVSEGGTTFYLFREFAEPGTKRDIFETADELPLRPTSSAIGPGRDRTETSVEAEEVPVAAAAVRRS
ncbi:MAG: hypothetical protein AAFS10_07815 [Myxococcota bacterium]